MRRIFYFLRRYGPGMMLVFILGLAPACTKKASLARHLGRADRFYAEKRYEEAGLEYLNVLQVNPNHPAALERLGDIDYQRGQTPQALALLLKARQAGATGEKTTWELARLLLLKGRIDEARKLAIAILDQNPASDQAIILLADANREEAQVTEATERVQEFLKKNGDRPAGHIALGKLEMRQGELAKAEAELARAEAADPNSSALHVALATLKWRQGDLKAADQHFQKAAELAPADWSTCLLRADFKVLTGATEEARKIVQEVQHRMPQNLPASLVLARVAVSEKKYDECLDLIDRVQRAGGADPELLLLQAQVNLAKGDARQAVADLEPLAQQFPKIPQFHYHLALAYLKVGQLAKAALSANQAAKLDPSFQDAVLLSSELAIRNNEFAEAVRKLTALLKGAPRAERAYPLLITAYRGQDALESAVAACQQWQQSFPASAQAPYVLGLIRRQQRQVAEARRAFTQAVALAPTFLQPVQQLIDLDLTEKNFTAALQKAEQLVSHDPKSALSQVLLAQVHLARGAPDQAELALTKALELDPASTEAGMLLAQVYTRANKRDQALEKLKAVVAKNPKDWHPLILLALLQQESGDYSGARSSYEKVIELNPKHAAAYNNLAYLCGERFNDLEAASLNARKARELAPEDASIADTLGWVLYRRQDYAKALPLLQEAADHQPANAEVQFHLGAAQYMMGQEALAQSTLQRALKSDQPFPGKQIAERRMRVLNLNPAVAKPAEIAQLQSDLAADPTDVVALLKVAAIADRAGESQKALGSYQAAVKVNPKSPALLLALGRYLGERMHDPGRGLEQAQLALELAPRDSTALKWVAQFALETGDYRRAFTLLTGLVEEQPKDPDLLYSLALATYARGRVPEAAAAARRALAASPAFPRATAAKKFLELVELGDDPARALVARSQLEQLVSTEPTNVPALMALAAVREQEGQFAEARKLYEEKVLGIYPEFAPAQRRLAFLYAEHFSDDAKALDLGLKAKELFREDPDLSKLLGQAALRRKDYAKAVPLLKEAIDKRPREADLFYALGMAYQGLNRRDLCKQALQKALDLNLERGLAQEASRVLGELK